MEDYEIQEDKERLLNDLDNLEINARQFLRKVASIRKKVEAIETENDLFRFYNRYDAEVFEIAISAFNYIL